MVHADSVIGIIKDVNVIIPMSALPTVKAPIRLKRYAEKKRMSLITILNCQFGFGFMVTCLLSSLDPTLFMLSRPNQ